MLNCKRKLRFQIHFSDVDECLLGEHNCDGNATCINTVRSYKCSCNDGFIGNGIICFGKSVLIKELIQSTNWAIYLQMMSMNVLQDLFLT